ncbi:MAG: NAD(P)-dependent glycerol-3-phosphate dehydrogenase [Deltaproteobacteria bacterium]|nr:NAD(P)-dependent glycerol-3-phosphate dehydrogenase [Deltaproteobacteria bacterium]
MKLPVGVIGGGSWGTTLAALIAATEHPVKLWCRDSKVVQEINAQHTNQAYTGAYLLSGYIQATTEIKEVITTCDLIFMVIPSRSFRSIAFEVGKWIQGNQLLVSATKGLELPRVKTMSEVLKEETCCKKIGVLSGPNIATDILQGDPSGTVIASPYQEVIERVRDVLNQPRFKVYGNKDIRGTEMAGALKNIIAISCGIAEGMGLKNNAKSFLITRGMMEMSRYGCFFGGELQTFYGLSGMGDLIATCFSPHSRNQTLGRHIAQGQKVEDAVKKIQGVVEGMYSTQAVFHMAKKFHIFMPITESIYRILFEGATVENEIKYLMEVRIKFEEGSLRTSYADLTHTLIPKYPIPEYLL